MRAVAPVVLRNASASGVSAVFLDVRLESSMADALRDYEPATDVGVTFEVRLNAVHLRLPARIVWYRRLPSTGQLAVAGFHLDLGAVAANDRDAYAGWVDEHTRGKDPAEPEPRLARTTRQILEEIGIELPPVPPREPPALDIAEAPHTPIGRAATEAYLADLRERARRLYL